MGVEKEVKNLEQRMFAMLVSVSEMVLLMKKEEVKVQLARIESLEKEYFTITKTRYVNQDYMKKTYERLSNGCR